MSNGGDDSSYLRRGDLIVLKTEDRSSFLSATDILDPKSETFNLNLLKSQGGKHGAESAGVDTDFFSSCVFKVGSASERENLGDIVTFGSVIRLLLMRTHSYVTIHENHIVNGEEVALHPCLRSSDDLSQTEEKYCNYYVYSRFKIRSEGDRVRQGDVVYLQSAENYGNLRSQHLIGNHRGVSISPEKFGWCLVPFSNYNAKARSCVNSGDILRLLHQEEEAFLLGNINDSENRMIRDPTEKMSNLIGMMFDPATGALALQTEVDPVLRSVAKKSSGLSNFAKQVDIESAWQVEKESLLAGNQIRWNEGFRLKHVRTNRYLALQEVKTHHDMGDDDIGLLGGGGEPKKLNPLQNAVNAITAANYMAASSSRGNLDLSEKTATMEGYLEKHGKVGILKKRYFALDDDHFRCYRSKSDAGASEGNPQWTEMMKGDIISRHRCGDRDFLVHSADEEGRLVRVTKYSAPTVEERKAWVAHLGRSTGAGKSEEKEYFLELVPTFDAQRCLFEFVQVDADKSRKNQFVDHNEFTRLRHVGSKHFVSTHAPDADDGIVDFGYSGGGRAGSSQNDTSSQGASSTGDASSNQEGSAGVSSMGASAMTGADNIGGVDPSLVGISDTRHDQNLHTTSTVPDRDIFTVIPVRRQTVYDFCFMRGMLPDLVAFNNELTAATCVDWEAVTDNPLSDIPNSRLDKVIEILECYTCFILGEVHHGEKRVKDVLALTTTPIQRRQDTLVALHMVELLMSIIQKIYSVRLIIVSSDERLKDQPEKIRRDGRRKWDELCRKAYNLIRQSLRDGNDASTRRIVNIDGVADMIRHLSTPWQPPLTTIFEGGSTKLSGAIDKSDIHTVLDQVIL
jgi:hypothetical protein